ncbi:DUF1003 domain-containing protein [Lacrimispora sp.]|jgi:uncharacterized membrane protein|uniref:DUF1003 domain-containing protein n=1 Tax=Lacrimispora sp. TaxID=2719234 RepID=UPI0028A7BCBC|nr:DUF1003 domain-containing protein [Lacrimispora sp.]
MSNRLSNEEIVRQILCKDMENISEEEDIIHLLLNQQVAENLNNSHKDSATKGDKIADRLASVAGSWSFILGFGAVLMLWILINTVVITVHAFDPYPFILLNLILSCVAAIQAPVIMMSQNRQEKKDRLRAENDYRVNLKSELIVEDLHAKLDRLVERQEQICARLEALEVTK